MSYSLEPLTSVEHNALISWLSVSSPSEAQKIQSLPSDVVASLYGTFMPAGKQWDYFRAFRDVHVEHQESSHIAWTIVRFTNRITPLNAGSRFYRTGTFTNGIIKTHGSMTKLAANNGQVLSEFMTIDRNLSQYFSAYYVAAEALLFPGSDKMWTVRHLIGKFMTEAYDELGKRAPAMPYHGLV